MYFHKWRGRLAAGLAPTNLEILAIATAHKEEPRRQVIGARISRLSTGKFMQVVGTPIIQQHSCWRWFPLVIHDISAPLSSPHSELGTVGINPSVLALQRFGPKVLVSASHANNFFCILLHPRPCPSYLIFSLVRYTWFPVQGLRDGPDQKTQDTC